MAERRLTRAEAKARTGERLLRSAERLFTERGYARASLDDIAADAGYTKGAIYAHFDSKEDLFLAVQGRRGDVRRARLIDAVAGATTEAELLNRIGRWHHQHVRADAARFILDGEFGIVAVRDPQLREQVAAAFVEGAEGITMLIELQAQARGLELALPAPKVAKILFALMYGLQGLAQFDPDINDPDLFPLALALLLGLDPAVVDADQLDDRGAERADA